MSKLHKSLKLGLSAVLLSAATTATATTVTVTASATVDNAVDLTFTGSLGFGTIRAAISTTDDECSGLVLDADPSVTTMVAATTETAFAANCASGAGTSVITSIDGSISRPEFTITGVPAFQSLQMTAPTATELTLSGDPPGAAIFQLIDFSAYQTSGTPGDVTFGATALTADVNGEIAFTMGAVLATDDVGSGASGDYQDASYDGSFDVTVTY